MKALLPTIQRKLIFICSLLFVFILFQGGVSAQQYQFRSTGADGRDTIRTTRVVNSYAAVTGINSTIVSLAGPYIPQRGDRVLLIQMTGTDSGSWQWDTVKIGGNPCQLSHIYRQYDTAQ